MQEAADKEDERELTPDEIGRKIASQWTTDPDAAGSGDSPDAVEQTMQEEDDVGDTGTREEVSSCVHACCSCSFSLRNCTSANLRLTLLALLCDMSSHDM